MPRKQRIHIPGAVYHVILRGNDRRDVFADDKDRFHFCSIIEKVRRRIPFKIHAFCLMTNHIHLEIQVAGIPLPRIMQRITLRYAQWFNWRHHKSGHLFQGRYKAILVQTDEHLQDLAAYIHLNPVRTRIVKSPEKYKWSSHRAYLGKDSFPWLETDFVLSTFCSTDHSRAQSLFRGFVDSMADQGHNKGFHGEGNLDKRLLGDEFFVEEILEKTEELTPPRPSLEDIIETIEFVVGKDARHLLTTADRKAKSFEARALASWATIEFSSATLSELAKFCNRDQSTMSCAARRIEELQALRPDIKEKMEQLRTALTLPPKKRERPPLDQDS